LFSGIYINAPEADNPAFIRNYDQSALLYKAIPKRFILTSLRSNHRVVNSLNGFFVLRLGKTNGRPS
jgi:hypothetical protein